MKSESGFSLAMASLPLKEKKLQEDHPQTDAQGKGEFFNKYFKNKVWIKSSQC